MNDDTQIDPRQDQNEEQSTPVSNTPSVVQEPARPMTPRRPMRDRRKTVALLLTLLVILVVAAASVWLYLNETKSTSAPSQPVSTTTDSSPTNAAAQTATLDTVYTDKTGNFSVKYPSSWQLKTTTGTQGGPNSPTTSSTLTSPSGTVLVLNSDWGGRGGECEPKPNDKPFAKGNVCSSEQVLTAETLPINTVYYADDQQVGGSVKTTYAPAIVALITEHYADPDGSSQYTVGVTSTDTANGALVFGPVMGAYASFPWITVHDSKGTFEPYIYAYATGKTADFLKSGDVSTIKDILRTLSINL